MEIFTKIVNSFQSLTIFAKNLHLRYFTGFCTLQYIPVTVNKNRKIKIKRGFNYLKSATQCTKTMLRVRLDQCVLR